MNVVFYLAAVVAILSTLMVVTRTNAMHALLYLIVSLLAVALMFFLLGAPFVAALEVIVYAGAIMVLFIFAIMLLNLGPQTTQLENNMLQLSAWRGPAALALVLLVELVIILASGNHGTGANVVVEPKQVGISMFGPYLIGVELASILLLASLVGAYHIGQRPVEREAALSRTELAQAPRSVVTQPVPEPQVTVNPAQGTSAMEGPDGEKGSQAQGAA
jgi:NADH-quinone oxidoreductase subunit J